ncbi:MAG: hypothetical protein HY824_03640 [Acidobacteria bacterium]|nr:hypothetical protein [Acidobacteriota bacterium]
MARAGLYFRPEEASMGYVSVSLLMTAMVIVGFWPTYFGPVLRGDGERPWVFHLHGAVFIGWMGLLVTQVALVSSGRTRLHRTLGTLGIGYGAMVLAIGLLITFYAPAMHMASGAWDINAAASFLLLPLADMVLFAGFFGAAIAYRRRPEVHKRLMLLATIALMFAAVSRRIPYDAPWAFLLVWLAPLGAAMAYDWRTRRGVHPTYLYGAAILLLAFCRVYVRESDAWLTIGRTLLAPFA